MDCVVALYSQYYLKDGVYVGGPWTAESLDERALDCSISKK
jgi:hypothetical protein